MMRGRFAPSPTGRMHLGNARSALLGWLQARAAGGRFLVRVEDLDRARCRPEHVQVLWEDLRWLGLDWDEPPLFQSAREEAGAYREALERLSREGRIYPCFCTRAEVARAASAPHGPFDDGPRYPGTCAHLSTAQAEARARTRAPALRFRVPEGTRVRFVDGVHGAVEQDVAQAVGDFVVRRNDGVASYQLAVVADDAASGITHVLRGDDLLGSTPRQLLLFEALGHAPPPAYAHVPLVLGEDGKRLAKREGAFALADLRARGLPPERALGLLALWSGLGDGSPVSAAELVERFSLERLPRAPVTALQAQLEAALGWD
ncbi:tRNA glutamyl-Q(34) synthetase GluQRS [Aggregicoccus sp. 17bor-14]|uniref:tRNA glutamyl-Q(34) synthetase GluQRS n=1 Tax=Myxococcaceae TaxID=31 RepID=UPI00129CCD99|nr:MULTISPECIES: tRNA glutamyl-Q(34) synthetase GluQRS [Myxococcaceae]MBF5043586.1 tRNA glutamyl-Q(34) synthetase GluQRS [Simulacricoccus sp. 17bor-14]MRI89345.1 tRNA glutamyl-Q(34) synthetase GluQRS [Aggregicoccus sp. 17bor-14]